MQLVGCLLFGLFGLAQIVSAYNGIEYYWGFWASVIVMAFASCSGSHYLLQYFLFLERCMFGTGRGMER